MAGSGKSRAEENKAIRQEALREQLSAQGHVQHVVDISTKLANLDVDLEQADVQRLKAAADIKLKLIAKYAPDLKAVEHSGEINSNEPSTMSDDAIISRLAELEGRRGITEGDTEKTSSKETTH